MATGSPGASRSRPKAMMVTSNATGIINTTLRTMYRIMGSVRPEQRGFQRGRSAKAHRDRRYDASEGVPHHGSVRPEQQGFQRGAAPLTPGGTASRGASEAMRRHALIYL